MIVKILGNRETPAYKVAENVFGKMVIEHLMETPVPADLAIAPLLTEKVPPEYRRTAPRDVDILSPLPYGRGASSIRWAYKRNRPITAATWFWADDGYDTGDICEQEIVKIDYSSRPRLL